jgi:hypothetical protein
MNATFKTFKQWQDAVTVSLPTAKIVGDNKFARAFIEGHKPAVAYWTGKVGQVQL